MGKTKQRCVRFNLNSTITEKEFPVDNGVISDDDGRKVKFTPNDVFPPAQEQQRFWHKLKFWRWFKVKTSCLFFVEGAVQALTWSKMLKGLQLYWTQTEARMFVKKMVALEGMLFKPLKNWQFALLLIINVAGLAVGLRMLQLMGNI